MFSIFAHTPIKTSVNARKYFLFIIMAIIHQATVGQPIKAPNETINGKKNGHWNDLVFLDTMSIDGQRSLLLGQHHAPLYGSSEGIYLNGEKTGIWQYFWTEAFLDSGNVKYRKAPLKDVIVYEEGIRTGLFLSYFKCGQIRLIGQYKKVREFFADTIMLSNPDTGIDRDSVIYSYHSSILTGNWYEYKESGNLGNMVEYNDQGIRKPEDL